MKIDFKKLSLRERAALFFDLVETPGWKLLQQYFSPEIKIRVTNADSREQFMYESIRAQVIQEFFNIPRYVMRQAEQAWSRNGISSISLLENETEEDLSKNTVSKISPQDFTE
jgi:hypothetical protein